MKIWTARIAYVLLNALLIYVLWGCIQVYTSLISTSLPWYEPCGMQFMALALVATPVLLLTGIGHIITGCFLRISTSMKLIPFVASVVIPIPAVIDTSLKNTGLQVTGAVIAGTIIIVTLVLVARDLYKMRSPRHSSG